MAVFRFEATQGKVNASFSNTGTLNVPDGVAFLDITDGVTATLQTVRLPVRTGLFTTIYSIGGYGQFAVNDGSRFIFTPEEDTKSGTILRLASTDRTPAVFYIHSKEGLTGNLRAEQFTTTDPEVWTVTLLGDGEDPTATDLQFDYIAKQDAGQSMAIYASRLSRDRGFRISELIEPLRVEQTYNAFVRPYYSESDLRFADDASIAASGIVFGATARLSPVLEHGPHFIAERAGYDAWDNRQDADSDAFGFGWHVLWRPINVLYVKAYATGMYASTDLDYQTELDRAADDFNDWSFFADLRVGHEFSAGSLGLLTPELGLSWAYNKTDDFKLTFGSGEVRRYESADQSDVFATAKLKWSGVFESADSYVRPELSFGIRTLLTDPEIDSVSHAGGQRHASSIDDDRCVGTVSAGLFVGNDDWTIALHGLGAFGANSSYRAVAATIGYHW